MNVVAFRTAPPIAGLSCFFNLSIEVTEFGNQTGENVEKVRGQIVRRESGELCQLIGGCPYRS